jgi:hypothetical protein
VVGTNINTFLFIYVLSKLQKSVADLETLHREKNGANFVIPSSHVREKVSILSMHTI